MKTIYKIGEWEQEHKQNWINALNYKRHLDTLPDFSSRLQYWQEVVSKSGVIHEMDYVGDTGKVAFQLSPKPETDDDRQRLAKFRLSWYKEMYTKNAEKVFKLDWTGFDDEDYSFIIRSLDSLKTDLDQRLSKSMRPDDFLRQELDAISEVIASGGFRKTKPEYDRAVKSLRQSIETNQPLDLLHFDKTVNHARGIELLAMIWDIVHYESYLKDTIAQLKNKNIGVSNSEKKDKPQPKITQDILALFYYYCHETACLPAFPAGKMEQAYKEAVKNYELSHKAFQIHYNMMKDASQRLSNYKAISGAIKMLEKYPKALQLANDELAVAKTRKPIT